MESRKLHLLVAGVPVTARHNGEAWLVSAGRHTKTVHGIKAKAGAGLLTVELSKHDLFRGENRVLAWIEAFWNSVFELNGVKAYLFSMTRNERVTVAKRELGIIGGAL